MHTLPVFGSRVNALMQIRKLSRHVNYKNMGNRNIVLIALIGLSLTFGTSCSKDDTPPGSSSGSHVGTIYYENYEGFSKVSLATKQKTIIKHTGNHYNWHITGDGTTILEMTDGRSSGRPDHIHFTIRNLGTGEHIKDFFYRPVKGGSIFQEADLSPDKSMICIFPSFDEGFVFLNAATGAVMAHIEDINGEPIPRNQSFAWLPDNSLLIKWKQHILKTKYPFDDITIVAEFDTEAFHSFSVNAQGTRIAMKYQKHIAVMNTDGSGFYMATSGSEEESSASFSPDGKYLVVGTDVRSIGVPGSVPSQQSFMKIIPADGKTYAVDQDGADIVPVIPQGETSAEPQKGLMVWTP
ncbi:hypothetical protein FAZ19_07440 [Sphingobacterium alkalisoli]|uniref:WD40 repeat domain-containing protein n=2 Tax=Sphingobacterium alkalisoli TaxID=1874115 RepID=A0A4U0H662_9SPHI|nr:hypothetical protein FAZ19_07440 [Sphingobacterium alkalisoli]GGH14474.1 hypothetical protein GCM10011418_15450 [Sphingobacterium alkalisoli]